MANSTTLGFSILSRYNGRGMTQARRDIAETRAFMGLLNNDLQKHTNILSGIPKRWRAIGMATAGIAPALVPLTAQLLATSGALVTMATSAGVAAGVWGAALKGALGRINDTSLGLLGLGKNLSKQKAILANMTPGTEHYGKQLKKVNAAQDQYNHALADANPAQRSFMTNVSHMSDAWQKFITDTEGQTLGVAGKALWALGDAIGRLKPLVDAVTPIAAGVADAFQRWVDIRMDDWVAFFAKTGPQALRQFVTIAKNLGATFGIMLKAFAGDADKLGNGLARASAELRSWAEGGGFERFLTYVHNNSPSVQAFFRAFMGALRNIKNILMEFSDGSLKVLTDALRVIAAIDPSGLRAFLNVMVLLKSPFLWLLLNCPPLRDLIVKLMGAMNAPTVYALAAAFGVLKVAMLAMNLGLISSPIGWVIIALAGLAVAITMVATKTTWFQTAWTYTWNAIKQVAEWVWNGLKATFNAVVNFLGSKWGWLIAILGPIGWLIAIAAHWSQVWNGIKAVAATVWGWLKTAWNSTTNAMRVAWDAVGHALGAAWNSVWTWINAVGVKIWGWLKSGWNSAIHWMLNVWNTVAHAIGSAWNSTWTWINAVGVKIWGWIKSGWSGAIHWVYDKLKQVGQWIEDKWSAIWSSVKAIAKKAWHGIGEVIEGAINGAIGMVNGLIKGFNNITSFLHIDVKIGDIDKVKLNFAKGGMVPVQAFAVGGMANGVRQFAGGGTIGGYAPGRDTVPAMLSPGEGVLTPEAVRGLGGPGFVHSANRTFAGHRGAGSGPKLGGFSEGGMVQHFAIGGMVADGLKRAGISSSLVTQGEYSNGSLSAGTHSGGGVIDLAANPNNQAAMVGALRKAGFAAWFRTPSEGFSYHIHAVQMSNPNLSAAARAQVESYKHGGNGLANGGPDTGGGGFDIMALVRDNVGKILKNVYGGGKALAGVAGDIANWFADDDQGGFLGSGIGPDIGPNVVGGAKKAAKTAFGVSDDLGKLVLTMLSKGNIAEGLSGAKGPLGKLGGMAGGLGKIVQGVGKKVMDNIMPDFLKKKSDDAPAFTLSSLMPGGGEGTGKWKTLAAMALQIVGLSGPNVLNDFMGLMAAESGGNPRAINNWDSNAKAGIPSKGLMQVIDPTFRQYHVAGTSNDIYDPLANMAASANYIKHVYGGRIPGSPYALGTSGATRGVHLVGERGPELVNFMGGQKVTPAKETAAILSPRGESGGGIVFHIHADGNTDAQEIVEAINTQAAPQLRRLLAKGTGSN